MIDEGVVEIDRARAYERKKCVREVRAQADDYRRAARATKADGTFCFDKQKRGQFITSAEALEQMASIMEGRQ
jgi:hypothetical protein